ncbi:hypothetical protein ACE6H2_007786 [Prunus campanulata]
MRLLQHGYSVRATVRSNPSGNSDQMTYNVLISDDENHTKQLEILLSHSQVPFESIGGKEECGSSNQSIKSPFLRLTGDIRMDQPGVVSEGISQMELSQQSLISGLPDDIALFCLARVPRNGTWQHADADMVAGWRGPAVVVDGTLYVLDQSSGTRLIIWQKESREWIPVGRLSSLLTRPPCQLVAIGKKFYVVGKGLSTVMFDVENAGNMEGVMYSNASTNSSPSSRPSSTEGKACRLKGAYAKDEGKHDYNQ